MCEFETTEEIEQRRSESERIARLSRIEARFEEIIRRAYNYGYPPLVLELDHIWKEAERIESFLESKRAEVKDGK